MKMHLHSQAQNETLNFLLHAKDCHINLCSNIPYCYETKQLWYHIQTCSLPDCSYPHCFIGRSAVQHFYNCKEQRQCLICQPSRNIERNGEENNLFNVNFYPRIADLKITLEDDQNMSGNSPLVLSCLTSTSSNEQENYDSDEDDNISAITEASVSSSKNKTLTRKTTKKKSLEKPGKTKGKRVTSPSLKFSKDKKESQQSKWNEITQPPLPNTTKVQVPEDETARDKLIQSHLILFQHSLDCPSSHNAGGGSSLCSSKNCQKMKEFFAHFTFHSPSAFSCKAGSSTLKLTEHDDVHKINPVDCTLCKRMRNLCKLHSKYCRNPSNCSVSYCQETYKNSLKSLPQIFVH
jgi:hypothetical protein